MIIPKVIHQIWDGSRQRCPESFVAMAETWKTIHPEWKYEFWDHERIYKFIQSYYPQYLKKYESFKYDVQRWDAIRYLILNSIGGMYVDFDYECISSFDNLLDGKQCCFAEEPKEHAEVFPFDKFFNNALMASVPEHPFFHEIILQVFTEKDENINYSHKNLEVLETTGPLMLTKLLMRYKEANDIFIIPAELVSPLSKDDVQIYFSAEENETEVVSYLENKLTKAMAVHYFMGTWC